MAALLSDAENDKTQPTIRQTDVIFLSLGYKNDAKLFHLFVYFYLTKQIKCKSFGGTQLV